MKKLAIIGGNGMLGADLVKYFSQAFSVTSISKDNYSEHVNKEFDIVINANGNSKRFWANNNILEDFAISTVSVYKSIFDFKHSIYIYISSSDVYENHSATEYTNEDLLINSANLSPYGLHKYLSELIVKNHVNNYIILRCSMILGQRLKKGPIYDILQGKNLYITKNSYLQMITSEEIADIISFLLHKKNKKITFNVGGKGRVFFEDVNKFFSSQVMFDSKAQLQEYEMNVSKLASMYPLKTSQDYLKEYLKSVTV